MSVLIDKEKCIGCNRCIDICPGNLIESGADKKAVLQCPQDCWSCCSCMKECPTQAISLILPPEMNGNGAKMKLRREENLTMWEILKTDGSIVTFVTDTGEANQY